MSLPRRIAPAILALLLWAGALPAAAQSPGPDQSPPASPSPAGRSAAPGQSAAPASPAASADPCVEPEASAAPVIEETLSMPEDFRIGLFNGVWEGIRDYYVDPATNGLDWEAIGDEYAPLVVATDNAHEVYELLREMVALLEDPYTGFFSPDDIGAAEAVDPTYGGIGALIEGADDGSAGASTEGLRILYVFDGGSAEAAGLAARDRIIAVEGDPCARISDIRGPQGTDVTITVVSPGEPPRDVTLPRARIDPTIRPEARRLAADPRVGYLRVLALSGQEAIDGIEQGLTRLVRDEPIEGLVIDLRASNQGAPLVMTELLRAFVRGEVGAFHSRVGDEPIEIEPNDLAEAYAGMPVVVLVDELSEAEAEQAAAILQDQGRATVIGVQTAGKTHGAQSVDFGDGSLLQIVSFGFRLPDGRTLEGSGVTPDIEVAADWLAYPEAEDPFLVAALEVIDATLAEAAESPGAEGSPEPPESTEAVAASPAPTASAESTEAAESPAPSAVPAG